MQGDRLVCPPAMTVRDPRAAGLTAESTLTGGGFAASFMGNECCPKKRKTKVSLQNDLCCIAQKIRLRRLVFVFFLFLSNFQEFLYIVLLN